MAVVETPFALECLERKRKRLEPIYGSCDKNGIKEGGFYKLIRVRGIILVMQKNTVVYSGVWIRNFDEVQMM